MCRHLAYLGPQVSVRDLLTEGEHSLLQQSFQPRDMRRGGVINADGYGAAWWDKSALHRYRSVTPIWADASGCETLSAVGGNAILAAVRSATIGMPVVETACAPFIYGPWAFSHNGFVAGWPDSLAEPARTLPVTDLMTLEAPTDSAVLWALLRHRCAKDASTGEWAAAVAELTNRTRESAPGSRLNFLLSNGSQIIATTCVHSLSVLLTDDVVLVASEPTTDDKGWRHVKDGQLIVAEPGRLRITPLNRQ
ncbi:ergothioneine biosynthesis protein EgtC [Hoyosella subflava]|uniref:Gamma-glutamyl-hercynylcysteine sulfoxide hydrolase n=1 Tax=Hoyosella subflava (strain DSM 45089 / JCM 17490 / NBRC 109087 / DQS3-9A1) TaxID=443218 RepID=F6EPS8_HOYSD|nr:ergothioneine biosynthesis protein EgtC [Hoyosella subflava]AEF40557.1 hypothetical protein AS9A_2108 [Hoyosella subflava DQS3-9A1]